MPPPPRERIWVPRVVAGCPAAEAEGSVDSRAVPQPLRAATRCLLVVAGAVGLVVLAGDAAVAQAPSGGEAITGRLVDASGQPVAGVRLEVRQDGDAVGETTSGADGVWRVPVPGAGQYEVELDAGTLPEGLAPRDPERTVLPRVLVFEGREKAVVFPLGAGETEQPSRFERFAQLAFSGLRIGLVVGVSAIGLSLIFGTTGLTNFSHGELLTFGALVTWWANARTGLGLPFVLAALVGVSAGGLFGGAQDRLLWGPLRRRRVGLISAMVVSIGLSIFLQNVYLLVFGGQPRPYRQYAAQKPVDLGLLSVPPKELVIVAVCSVVLAGVALALQRTRLGTAVRAVADNKDLAAASGIDVGRVIRTVWVSGAALAALGGVMLGLTEQVQWNMGFRFLLVMFAAVVVGGLGTAYGPILGGLLIGLVSEFSTYWFPSDFKIVFALAVLVIVLLVRPQGILGVRERIG